ncbi:MAG: ribonuclease III [Candidatus Aminicenantales bacterium]|jgi:ribonuclease-3
MKTDRIEKAAGYSFKDAELLRKALTHSSHAYENQPDGPQDNELLEFLGDSVIGLATAEFYFKAFPDRTEGELSKLKASATSTLALAREARRIKLDRAILLGRGEEKSGGRTKGSILAGAFEALVGAIFLDGGFEAARAFIHRLLAPTLKPIQTETFQINNYKSALQELFQKADLPAPAYTTITAKGPEHKKTFTVEVSLNGKPLAKAKGPSKKAAEQRAAQKALKSYLGRKMKEISPEAFIVEGDE